MTVGKGTKFEGTQKLSVEVLPNHAPVVTGRFSDVVVDANQGETISLNLADYFNDEDGEALVYTVTSDASTVVSSSVSAGTLALQALTYGQTVVTVTAKDARGESAGQSFILLARDTSRIVDLYPNPVSSLLYVRPSADGSVSLSFFNQAGAQVLEESVDSKLFEPARIDVRSLPAGIYTVKAEVGGQEFSQTIVKL